MYELSGQWESVHFLLDAFPLFTLGVRFLLKITYLQNKNGFKM